MNKEFGAALRRVNSGGHFDDGGGYRETRVLVLEGFGRLSLFSNDTWVPNVQGTLGDGQKWGSSNDCCLGIMYHGAKEIQSQEE